MVVKINIDVSFHVDSDGNAVIFLFSVSMIVNTHSLTHSRQHDELPDRAEDDKLNAVPGLPLTCTTA